MSLTLGKAQDLALSMLKEAVADAASPLHAAVLASHGSEGPEARNVILRALALAPLSLTIWSDIRSGKVTQVSASPAVSLVLYDPRREIQLRLKGRAMIVSDSERLDAIWRTASLASRRAYLAAASPGTRLAAPHSGLPDDLDDTLPTLEQVEAGRKNFTAIEIAVTGLDLLILGRHGHRRATFSPHADGLSGQWLVP